MLEVEAVDEKTELKDNVIMSAGYKDETNYTDNMVCGWNITSTNGTGKMIITLHDFQLEESKQCSKFDYVRVFQRGIGPEWTVVSYCLYYCPPPSLVYCWQNNKKYKPRKKIEKYIY